MNVFDYKPIDFNAFYYGPKQVVPDYSPEKGAQGRAWTHPDYPSKCLFWPRGTPLTEHNVFIVRPENVMFN